MKKLTPERVFFAVIVIITFWIGYFTYPAYNKQKEVIVYLDGTIYIAVDMQNNKTIIDNDLSDLIKYCNENNYKIIDIIDKTKN